jgi:hypothetical protein
VVFVDFMRQNEHFRAIWNKEKIKKPSRARRRAIQPGELRFRIHVQKGKNDL